MLNLPFDRVKGDNSAVLDLRSFNIEFFCLVEFVHGKTS